MYIFTNLFPNYVSEAIPFVNEARTNIELKVAIPGSFHLYNVYSSGTQENDTFIFNNTCLSDVNFIIANGMDTHIHGILKFSFKVGQGNTYPSPLRPFEQAAIEVFSKHQEFLKFTFSEVANGTEVMNLPVLNVRPMVLSKEMCIFDQSWIATQANNFEYYLAQCFIHQYFCNTLLPYSPPIRFISEGLFTYYSILGLKNKDEQDWRLLTLMNQVLIDEENEETATLLFRSYAEDYPIDQRRGNKCAYLMHMIRSHFTEPEEFDKVIQNFMETL